MAEDRASENPVYELKITLRGSDPAIWRRLQVPARIWLGRLHHIFQATMGWQDGYLHRFEANDRVYGLPVMDRDLRYSEDEMPEGLDLSQTLHEASITLDQIAPEPGVTFRYIYGFANRWEGHVELETIRSAKSGEAFPRILSGSGAAPPEDMEGIHQYQNVILNVLNDPDHPDYERWRTWVDETAFDPHAFSVEEINGSVRRYRNFTSFDENLLEDVLHIDPVETQALYDDMAGVLRLVLEEVHDLPDGFALRFMGGPLFCQMTAFFISLAYNRHTEFRFEQTVAPDSGPIWLHLTGPGARAFVGETFGLS
jgi:hypothetical protein